MENEFYSRKYIWMQRFPKENVRKYHEETFLCIVIAYSFSAAFLVLSRLTYVMTHLSPPQICLTKLLCLLKIFLRQCKLQSLLYSQLYPLVCNQPGASPLDDFQEAIQTFRTTAYLKHPLYIRNKQPYSASNNWQREPLV